MNIAFSTVILFLLILPGVAFRRAYYSGDFSRKHIVKTPIEIFVDALIPGIIFQVLGVIFLSFLAEEFHLNFVQLSYLIVGAQEDIHLARAFDHIGRDFVKIVIYNFVICIIAAFLGYLYRGVVRRCKIDINHRYFRFPNEWYYILNGEVLQFPDNQLQVKEFDFIYLDVLTKTVNESIIYSGRLNLWYLEQGTLSSVVIDNVNRRVLSDNHDGKELRKEKDAYFSIPGDFIVILCKEIININVRYISFDELMRQQEILLPETIES